ncbi:hypothetical protein [Achromobacter aegrifaciens]
MRNEMLGAIVPEILIFDLGRFNQMLALAAQTQLNMVNAQLVAP